MVGLFRTMAYFWAVDNNPQFWQHNHCMEWGLAWIKHIFRSIFTMTQKPVN
jgi:hypothetical protein